MDYICAENKMNLIFNIQLLTTKNLRYFQAQQNFLS